MVNRKHHSLQKTGKIEHHGRNRRLGATTGRDGGGIGGEGSTELRVKREKMEALELGRGRRAAAKRSKIRNAEPRRLYLRGAISYFLFQNGLENDPYMGLIYNPPGPN
nr:hypothetical protein Itr_chr15CG00930 [Ipomoea trifida]